MRGLWLAPSLFVCAFCESNQVPPAPQTFDLGDSTLATFSNGALSVTRDGAPLLASPNGTPLMTRAHDTDSPDEWHDPSKSFTFDTIDPRTITIESPSAGVLHVTTPDDTLDTVLLRVSLASDDGFYTGLGEKFTHVDARGEITPMHMLVNATIESATNDAHVPVPLLVSSKGYGVFFESHEAGAFDVAATDPNVVTATFEGKVSSVWFFFARDPLEVVAQYNQYVGLPRVLPRWALGPMYWRNEFSGTDQVLSDAAMFRTLHIPTTTMWIDNPWQTAWNTFVADPNKYADPATLLGEMGALGFRMMFWSEPYLEKPGTGPHDEAQDLYTQAAAIPGALVRLHDGAIFAAPGSDNSKQFGMIDFTTSAGRDFWAGIASRAVSIGAAGFKLDYGEDIIAQIFNARIGIIYADGETDRTARNYPRDYHMAYHQALDAARPDGVLLVRASSYGGAQNADIIWPGDLDPDFSKRGDPTGQGTVFTGGLPAAIVAAETLSVSGFPNFGSDTGGFRHGAPTKEALLRWAEHTALSMVMQLGGGGDTHAPWAYDDDTVTLYKNLATLHTDLEPYLSSLSRDAETLGLPTIRPVPLAFPTDVASFPFADSEYMLGGDLLVSLVITQGATNQTVHFPPGKWANFATGEVTTGPLEVTVDAPLGAPTFYARVGAIVPMLASDVDTLVDATVGSVVSASQRPTFEARGWPSGKASAQFDDGSQILIDDTSQGVSVTFLPGSFGTGIVCTLDLRSRTGKTSPLTHVVIGQDEVPLLATEADVRAAAGSAFVINGDSIVLRISGSATAWIE